MLSFIYNEFNPRALHKVKFRSRASVDHWLNLRRGARSGKGQRAGVGGEEDFGGARRCQGQDESD